jgi:hypothetical protein
MTSVGVYVQQTIDLMNSGSHDLAILPTAAAINASTAKVIENASVGELSIERFIRESWPLITFMGLPNALPIPMSIPFAFKRIMPTFNSLHGAEEIISLLVNRTLQLGRVPPEFAFDSTEQFEIRGERLYLPTDLIWGLIGGVVFHPVNAGEEIDEKYWISVSEFRMFVSELFGRKDLAERIMRQPRDWLKSH